MGTRSLPVSRNVIPKFLLKKVAKGPLVLTTTRAELILSRAATKTAIESVRIATNVLMGWVLWVHLLIFSCNKRSISTRGKNLAYVPLAFA